MKKVIAIALTLIMVLCLFVGCKKDKPDAQGTAAPTTTQAKDQNQTEPQTTAAPETDAPTSEAPTTEPVESEAPSTEPAETEESQPDVPETEAPSTEQNPDNGDDLSLVEGLTINDAAIVIDGVLYKSEDPYSKMVENGWDFNYEDYSNVDETYVLNKGEYIYSTIKLHNQEKYGKGYVSPAITIGLINNNEEVTQIKSCYVHGIKVEGVSGFTRYEDRSEPVQCYDFMLWNGIRRGDSMEKIKSVMGEPTNPDDTYVGDGDNYHYEILSYEGDHVTYKLTVYSNPDIGLQAVEISDTRNWTRR